MGERVTLQGDRPRLEGMIGKYRDDLVSNMDGLGGFGPFTRKNYIEFLYRVKEIRVQATANWSTTSPVDSGTYTLDVTLSRRKTRGASFVTQDELTQEQCLPGEMLNDPGLWVLFKDDLESALQVPTPLESVRDENAEWWFDIFLGSFSCSNDNLILTCNGFTPGSPYSATMTFSDSGTVDMEFEVIPGPFAAAGATIDSATVTVTITKWFPYALKNGDPAWDEDTGLELADIGS